MEVSATEEEMLLEGPSSTSNNTPVRRVLDRSSAISPGRSPVRTPSPVRSPSPIARTVRRPARRSRGSSTPRRLRRRGRPRSRSQRRRTRSRSPRQRTNRTDRIGTGRVSHDTAAGVSDSLPHQIRSPSTSPTRAIMSIRSPSESPDKSPPPVDPRQLSRGNDLMRESGVRWQLIRITLGDADEVESPAVVEDPRGAPPPPPPTRPSPPRSQPHSIQSAPVIPARFVTEKFRLIRGMLDGSAIVLVKTEHFHKFEDELRLLYSSNNLEQFKLSTKLILRECESFIRGIIHDNDRRRWYCLLYINTMFKRAFRLSEYVGFLRDCPLRDCTLVREYWNDFLSI